MASLISESLQICYFPFSPQANGALKPHGTPPHLPPRWQNAAIFTISSWKANLAAAGRNDCQHRLVPSGPCADKLSFILKLQSKVSCRRRGDIFKVIWLFLFDTVCWTALHAAKFSHFNTHSFSRRRYLKDVSSFGMQSAALSLPDVILSDWGRNSRDCFWGAVTHDCACAAAKLSQ